MHEVIDTEAVDAVEELFWPHEFKSLLRGETRNAVSAWLHAQTLIKKLHQKETRKKPLKYDFFVESLATKIIIGAENGADDAFEMIHKAFSHGFNFPCLTQWIENTLGREVFTDEICLPIQEEICAAYRNEHLYEHIYEDYYAKTYPSFEMFINDVSEHVLAGIVNGAESMFRKILRSFIFNISLPPATRHPRAIKGLS